MFTHELTTRTLWMETTQLQWPVELHVHADDVAIAEAAALVGAENERDFFPLHGVAIIPHDSGWQPGQWFVVGHAAEPVINPEADHDAIPSPLGGPTIQDEGFDGEPKPEEPGDGSAVDQPDLEWPEDEPVV